MSARADRVIEERDRPAHLPPGTSAAALRAGTGPETQGLAEHAHFTTWLFRADAEPRQVELAELRAIVAADANFAWIDLSGASAQELRGR